MATLTIKLTKDHLEFAEAQAAERGHRTVGAYLDDLLRTEQKRKAEEKLLALVREAEASGPATPMTREDWDNLKRRVWQRHTHAKGGSGGKNRQVKRRRTGS